MKKCKCLPGIIDRYQKRVSGPLMDRIDLHVDVPAVKVEKLTTEEKETAESSESIRKKVQLARDLQTKRFKNAHIFCNAEMSTRDIKKFCPLSQDCLILLRQAVSQLNLSARSYYKVIKISRTIADLAGAKEITDNHISEALLYRPKDVD